jgi:hypothetical protein
MDQSRIVGYSLAWEEEWTTYTAKLARGHIFLIDKPDELIWSYNSSGGEYSAKLGYHLELVDVDETRSSWWKKHWKSKSPLKCLLFMWLILHNKVLNLGRFQKKNF